MKKFSQLALPYIIWSIIILLLPVLLIAFYAITDRGNTVVNFSFTLQNFVKFFTDPDFLLILWRSLSIALKTTDRKSTRLNSSHGDESRMPSSA